ncbi:hypothetical protein WJ96_07025 [Burkholderia ubonensis]|uniref:Bacteriophage protein n=2 Tax=Burkholderia ubonensis TaxID=101571 RepID=A0AAW3MTH0_9BURK|nr:hypothetical protein [Burkholderia ubonensis]KVP75453.1 hypothetical protein WJ93_08820 [Burkholderia ubonensis]KVP98266.1 hypothetical protein WJ96_07025 [Burkholderia ubonensis]KVZ92964.1 hypothetical protein WL25_18685 [Burkholderia ubonensis]
MVSMSTIQAITAAMHDAVLQAAKTKPVEFSRTHDDSEWSVRVEHDGTVHNGGVAMFLYGPYRTLEQLTNWELGALLDAAARDAVNAGVPESTVNPEAREQVCSAVAEALGDAYDCTRVWSAWSVGTMSQDDFARVADDDGRVGEIADAAIAALGAKPLLPTRALLEQAAQIALAHNYTGGGIDSAVKIRELAGGL